MTFTSVWGTNYVGPAPAYSEVPANGASTHTLTAAFT